MQEIDISMNGQNKLRLSALWELHRYAPRTILDGKIWTTLFIIDHNNQIFDQVIKDIGR